MKVRTGFVSNSSSSSFIIAVKTNATEEDVRNSLDERFSEFERYFGMYGEYMEVSSAKELLDECVSEIMTYQRKGIELDSWRVSAEEFSDEGEDDFASFMYGGLGSIKKDYLVIQGTN